MQSANTWKNYKQETDLVSGKGEKNIWRTVWLKKIEKYNRCTSKQKKNLNRFRISKKIVAIFIDVGEVYDKTSRNKTFNQHNNGEIQNATKMVANIKWQGEQKPQKWLHSAISRSEIENGCQLYGTASSKRLNNSTA